MEITEKHLEDIFQMLELHAWRYAKSKEECQGIIFAAGAMETRLRAVLKAKSEEDLKLGQEFGKEAIRILEETGELLSYKYECGHTFEHIIINTSVDNLAAYMEWKASKGGICLTCWIKQKEVNTNNSKLSNIVTADCQKNLSIK